MSTGWVKSTVSPLSVADTVAVSFTGVAVTVELASEPSAVYWYVPLSKLGLKLYPVSPNPLSPSSSVGLGLTEKTL